METKNSLLGFLKDSGVSAMICGRIEALIDAFNGNLDQFVIATRGQLESTYNKHHPDGSKGLGAATFRAIDLLRGRYRHANAQMREAAKAEAAEKTELQDNACEELRRNYLSRKIDLKTLHETCEWLEMMFTEIDLGSLIGHYEKISERKGGSRSSTRG